MLDDPSFGLLSEDVTSIKVVFGSVPSCKILVIKFSSSFFRIMSYGSRLIISMYESFLYNSYNQKYILKSN